jgi:2-polyprenyl-3-methyl-5-hydroxy-6-metoxy-1,4-benzoquinol methylase
MTWFSVVSAIVQKKMVNSSWHRERMAPSEAPWYLWLIVGQHVARYRFATAFVTGKKVADIACGAGYGTAMLAENGAHWVVGIDIDAEAIAYANRCYGGSRRQYRRADALRTGLPTGSIEVVVSFETIEHVTDAVRLLREFRRILKPGGLLIISSPNILAALGKNLYHTEEYTLDQFKDRLKDFHRVTWFGQTPLIPGTLSMLRMVNRYVPAPLKIAAAVRPWERDEIRPLRNNQDIHYRTFLAVARK